MKQTEKTAKNETEPMEQAILRAAERLFLDKGFALTSTTEIAREAGCNQALVHYYFRTKENLFEKIFEQKIRMLISNIFSIDREGGTTFLVRPVLQNILGLTDEAMDGFLEHRKEENVKIILQSLKP